MSRFGTQKFSTRVVPAQAVKKPRNVSLSRGSSSSFSLPAKRSNVRLMLVWITSIKEKNEPKNGEVARSSDKGAPRNEVNCHGAAERGGERRRGMALHRPWSNRTLVSLRRSRQRKRRRKKKVNLNIAYLFILITPLSPLEDFHNRFVLLPCRALHYQRARLEIVHVPLMQMLQIVCVPFVWGAEYAVPLSHFDCFIIFNISSSASACHLVQRSLNWMIARCKNCLDHRNFRRGEKLLGKNDTFVIFVIYLRVIKCFASLVYHFFFFFSPLNI